MKDNLLRPAASWADAKVLLVCDDSEIGRIWAYSLRERQLKVSLVASAEEAVAQWTETKPDLIIVDVNTSKLNGVELCRQLRQETTVPLLLFTSRNDEAHLLEAYQAGVDECVVKPLSPALFLAKVKVWLQRLWLIPEGLLPPLQTDDLHLDSVHRHVLLKDGRIVKLTALEFRLLHLLMSHQGWVLETEAIIEHVWGYRGHGNAVLLKNAIYRLRQKIEPDSTHPRYIQTEARLGYRFQP